MNNIPCSVLFWLISLPALAGALFAAEPDPNGILRKPIPDKLVVLTFDDGCASGYTVAAPVLKSMGFGGSFYVCDFDSFNTRKDWYLTWRQMKALIADGFELGNHTKGHGSSLNAFIAMEDELLAHDVLPRPTTVCWPLYAAGWSFCPDLEKMGYTFGRGGYEQRPYLPTMDNPFNVPSYTLNDGVTMEAFVKIVRRAVNGKVIVLTYHGVPDMEHPAVSVKAESFKEQMQYLKANNYKAIPLRDMAEYIDPVKAAKLPQKSPEFKEPEPFALATEEKPYAAPSARDIHEFGIQGLSQVEVSRTGIKLTVPYTTDVTALAPKIKVSDGATVTPASGEKVDFSRPLGYTVTGRDGSKKSYPVTLIRTPISSDKDILSFTVPNAAAVSIAWSGIGVYVPAATDVTALAPVVALSPYATVVPASGATLDFSKPQTYTVTAEDGSKKAYTVAVVKDDKLNSFFRNGGENGNLSDVSKWTNSAGTQSAPNAVGQSDYILNFTKAGSLELVNDFKQGFQLNELNLNTGRGQGVKLSGGMLAFKTSSATGVEPVIRNGDVFESHHFATPLELGADLTVNLRRGSLLLLNSVISGNGRLILNSPDMDYEVDNHGLRPNILRLDCRTNTFSGGTIINGGQLMVYAAEQGLGTGPVTLNEKGLIRLDNVPVTNPLIANGGLITGGPSWDASIILNGNTRIAGRFNLNEKNGGISGPGGLTMLGTGGTWGWDNDGFVVFHGVNTYTGPTVILRGTMKFKKAASLYNANPAKWTPSNITVATAATLVLSVGGKDEFTGEQVSALLKSLTTEVNNNGLMFGSFFCLDTGNATENIIISSDITDSKGNGGGWFIFKKMGDGTVGLTGRNTYAGQTFFEGGTLIVSSLNSVAGGKASSSLGAPTSPETGLIGFGGDCTLTYTGTGETTDRILDLTGEKQIVTIDQSGSGLLKFTSAIEISGFGHSKTFVLKGTGSGEIAGDIKNPYDRKNLATLALTKEGTGAWTLSGTNRFTGATSVTQGTLVLVKPGSLGEGTEISVADGATLELAFKGEMRVGKLTLGGTVQPAGTYSAKNSPKFIKGAGVIRN